MPARPAVFSPSSASSVRRRLVRPAAAVALLVAFAAAPVRAADLDGGVIPAPLAEGLPCESPAVHVWLGHFSGGYSHYLGPGQQIVLDYRDEKLCFPSQRSCNRYIAEMRRDFHRPEGYFTCLPIR